MLFQHWCAVKNKVNGVMEKDHWGYCKPDCPKEGKQHFTEILEADNADKDSYLNLKKKYSFFTFCIIGEMVFWNSYIQYIDLTKCREILADILNFLYSEKTLNLQILN